VFKLLAKHGVIVVPGDDFRVPGVDEPDGANSSTVTSGSGEVVLRLSYAAPSPEMIETGIARMVTGIQELIK